VEALVIECGGVGYGLFVTFEDFRGGEETKLLFIYEHIRENSHDLFGFKSWKLSICFEQCKRKWRGIKNGTVIVANSGEVRKTGAAGAT